MKTYVLGCFCFFSVCNLYAQGSASDRSKNSDIENVLLDKAISSYYKIAQDFAILYNAKMQTGYPKQILNVPYFKGEEYVKGNVSYDGMVYSDINLRLDLYKNELITTLPNGGNNVILQNRRVDYAYLHGFRIIFIHDDGQKGFPGSGYYIMHYNNKYQVFEKHIYTLDTKVEELVKTSFKKAVRYYVYNDGVYHMVNRKKAILNLFKDHKKELEHYIKQQKLDFRHNFAASLISVVKQYENLTGS